MLVYRLMYNLFGVNSFHYWEELFRYSYSSKSTLKILGLDFEVDHCLLYNLLRIFVPRFRF